VSPFVASASLHVATKGNPQKMPLNAALCINGIEMKKYIFAILTLFSSFVYAGEYAKEANDNPFLNGQLNPKYEGEVIAIAGEVVEIKPTEQNYLALKINLRLPNIESIWISSIAPQPDGGIKVGDMLIFKGFISTTESLDQSGKLKKLTGSNTLLMAVQSQRAK
jgi:hypothetical protein